MRLKTIALVSAAAAAALAVTAMAILVRTDFNAYRGVVAEELRAVTGRELAIGGDLHFSFSLVPSVTAESVTLANAAWGSGPDMVRVQRLEAEVALLPALWGEIQVKRVRLLAPEILIETDPEGRGNWQFGPMTAAQPGLPPVAPASPVAKPAGGAPTLPTIDEVEIREARVTFRDGRSGERRSLTLDTVTLAAENVAVPVKLALAGRIDDVALTVNGTLGPMAVLQRPGAPYPVNVELKLGETTARIDGVVREPFHRGEVELVLAAEGPEVGGLAALAGKTVPMLGPFRLAATARSDGRQLAIGDLKLSLAAIDLAGDATIVPGPARPRVTAHLASTRVNVPAVTQAMESAKPVASRAVAPPEGTAQVLPQRPARDGRIFPDDPLPLQLLALVDGELSYQAERVEVAGTVLGKLELAATVTDGVLKLSRFRVEVKGGQVEGDLDLSVATRTLSGRVAAKDVELGALLTETGASDDLVGGRTDLMAELKGQGGSVAEIMAGLDGTVSVATGGGRVSNRLFHRAGTGLMQMLQPFLGGRDQMALVCAISRYEIRDGLAATRTAYAETDRLAVTAAGTINLKSETLDLMASPRPKEAALQGLAVPVRIGGTLRRPVVAAEAGATARKAAEAVVGTLLLGPVGLLAPLVGGGERDSDGCVAVRARVGLGSVGAAGMPEPTAAAKPARPAKGTGGGIGGAFEDLGRGVKGLIGR